ncbi:MAG: type II toxin-antitoxin system VapC family toxin [Acidobacteriota bacterium]
MKLLLDSHAFLWWLMDAPKLSTEAKAIITDTRTIVHVSAVSIWEISIKANLGRIELGKSDLVGQIEANHFFELPVTARHAVAASALPRHHDDPFDRMLVAQARLEDLTLLTHDRNFRNYKVSTLST